MVYGWFTAGYFLARLFDVVQPMVVSEDVSPVGIGAVLMQAGQPVAFSFPTLTPKQKKYGQIEKDLLVVQLVLLLKSPTFVAIISEMSLFFCDFGSSKVLESDNGTQFACAEFRECCRSRGRPGHADP